MLSLQLFIYRNFHITTLFIIGTFVAIAVIYPELLFSSAHSQSATDTVLFTHMLDDQYHESGSLYADSHTGALDDQIYESGSLYAE